MRKRPKSLQPITIAPRDTSGLEVTDTMTLVIRDDEGRELRVKDGLNSRSPSRGVVVPMVLGGGQGSRNSGASTSSAYLHRGSSGIDEGEQLPAVSSSCQSMSPVWDVIGGTSSSTSATMLDTLGGVPEGGIRGQRGIGLGIFGGHYGANMKNSNNSNSNNRNMDATEAFCSGVSDTDVSPQGRGSSFHPIYSGNRNSITSGDEIYPSGEGAGGNMYMREQLQPPSSGSFGVSISYDDLRIGDVLGKGATGKVRLAQHKITKNIYALKYIAFEGFTDEARRMLEAELRQVQTAQKHENIVSSYEAFYRNGKVCIILEFMDAGSMTDVIRRHPDGIPEPVLAYLARELFKGLRHLNSAHVAHRDVKPPNLLVSTFGEVKLSDFGIAKTFSENTVAKTSSVLGSIPYLCPEMIKGEPYSYNCDIWSAGVTIAEIALGCYPIAIEDKNNMYALLEKLSEGTLEIAWEQTGRQISPALKDFVSKCLQPQEKRPLASELLESHHPFLELANDVSPDVAGKWFMKRKNSQSAITSSFIHMSQITTPTNMSPSQYCHNLVDGSHKSNPFSPRGSAKLAPDCGALGGRPCWEVGAGGFGWGGADGKKDPEEKKNQWVSPFFIPQGSAFQKGKG